jgi:hypothetical protein
MMNRDQMFRLLRPAMLGLASGLLLLAIPAHAQTGPFAGLAGAWTGTGQVQLKDGGSERIRCRANYTVAESGTGLKQVLNCASDSYRFVLTTNVNASGQNLSGSWSETDRNLNGTVSGRITPGNVSALVEANGFAASLSVQTSGNRQTIAIKSENTDLRGVNIVLNR